MQIPATQGSRQFVLFAHLESLPDSVTLPFPSSSVLAHLSIQTWPGAVGTVHRQPYSPGTYQPQKLTRDRGQDWAKTLGTENRRVVKQVIEICVEKNIGSKRNDFIWPLRQGRERGLCSESVNNANRLWKPFSREFHKFGFLFLFFFNLGSWIRILKKMDTGARFPNWNMNSYKIESFWQPKSALVLKYSDTSESQTCWPGNSSSQHTYREDPVLATLHNGLQSKEGVGTSIHAQCSGGQWPWLLSALISASW